MKCKFDIMPSALMFSGQFYEKWLSVREKNIKLLLETGTYIATIDSAYNYTYVLSRVWWVTQG